MSTAQENVNSGASLKTSSVANKPANSAIAMRTIDVRGRALSKAELLALMPRLKSSADQAVEQVRPILDQVRERGAEAIRDYCEQFDHVRPTNVRVPLEACQKALEELNPRVRAAIEESVRRMRAVCQSQLPQYFSTQLGPDAAVSQRWIPVERVGLYVPGGKAVYPTSVIMNVVPAQVAGVSSIAVATPPRPRVQSSQVLQDRQSSSTNPDLQNAHASQATQTLQDGLPDPTILATCAILGIDEIYAVGGAQAIAMFAYGAKGSEPQDGDILCDPVDKITGPGNIFVATAKSLVSSFVGIDSVAGPTEIAIIADSSANPTWLAADLIGQAEHDELAGSVLITDDEDLARRVVRELERMVPGTKHASRIRFSLQGEQSAIILTDDLAQSIEAANAYAAEHLEIHTANPDEVMPRIRNAGAIFKGFYSPVPLGDYMSGSNHVLPTSGTARFSEGLGVHTFLKPVEVIEYGEQGLRELAGRINDFAVSEDLPGHGQCVLSRFVPDAYEERTLEAQIIEAGLR